MSRYTHTNIADVEDIAPRYGFGELGASRFARTAIEAEQTGFAVHELRPGKRQAFGHRHETAEEVFLVLRGSGRVRLDDELLELGERDVLRVAPDVKRRFEAGPDGLELLVVGPHVEGDGEMLPDFWAAD